MPHFSPDRYLKKIYIVLMVGLITWYLYSIMSFSSQYRTPAWVAVLRCAAAVLAIWLGKMWRDKGFWALAIYFLIILGRVLFPENVITDSSVQEILLFAVWLFGACYGLGRVLTQKEARTLAAVLAGIWTVGMTAFSLIGIYAAWTDQTVYTLGGRSRWQIGGDLRMHPVFYSNTAASMLIVSALLLFCWIMVTEYKWIRIAGIPAFLSMLVLIALTDSRTCMAAFAAGFGSMAGYALFAAVRKKQGGRNAAAIAAGIVCVLVLTAGMIWCLGRITYVFNQAKISGEIIIPAARAEGDQSAATLLVHRGLDADTDMLNGRGYIWEKVIGYIRDNPKTLLTGTSVLNPMAGFAETESGINYSHCHCTLLQVLLESGIPGLLCVGAFLVILLLRSIRLLDPDNTVPKWLRFLPFAVFAVCAADLIECFMVLFRYYTPQQAIIFIMMGLICARGGKKEKTESTA